MTSPVVLAALLSGLFAAMLVRALVPPPTRLAPRVRPYTVGSRTALGAGADVGALLGTQSGVLRSLFAPIAAHVLRRLASMTRGSGDAGLDLRIRQAGMFPELGEGDRVAAYRLRQLANVMIAGAAGVAASAALRFTTGRGLAFVALGLVVGATRARGRLDRAVEERRRRMRIEIYTINQLLAMRVRAGGGVISAVAALVARGRGEAISELREALRLHQAGMAAAEAFTRIAELTPEAHCARTYRLLAIAEERGVDLAGGLLSLSEDVRESRREAIRRSATRRRAATLLPTIAILAPVMLLFIGAPLPSLLLGFR